MSKTMSVVLGISKNVNRWHSLRIAVGISLVAILLLVSSAGAVPSFSSSRKLKSKLILLFFIFIGIAIPVIVFSPNVQADSLRSIVPNSGTNQLNSVAAISPDYVWAVGVNKPVFVYPADGATLDYEGSYLFKVEPIVKAQEFLWGFFQNGEMVWENFRDEGTLSSNLYGIYPGTTSHSKFIPGNVEVWVRALIDGKWTDATIITIHLQSTTPTPTPTPTPTTFPTPSPTVSPTPVPIKIPVIFIPGVMGSKLDVKEKFDPNIQYLACIPYVYNKGDIVWFDISKILLNYRPCNGVYLDVLQLRDDGQTPVYPQVSLSDKILDSYFEPYYDTVRYLGDMYTLNTNLFVFPYDWRKDIGASTEQLDSLIDNATSKAGTQKVNIIAHSMGGLVAREYIRDPGHAKKVDTLVELGTPNVGTPTFLAHLLYDKCVNTNLLNLTDFCIMNGQETNKLVQNFTGAFELLPSKKYYQLYTDPNDFPFNDGRDIDQDKTTTGPLNYDQSKTLLTNLKKNMYIFDASESFHNNLDKSYSDNNGNTNGVNIFLIAGSGFPTIGQIKDYNKEIINIFGFPITYVKQDATRINGDGTVPLKSVTLDQKNNVYYVNKKHSDLASNLTTLSMAIRLLNKDTSVIDGVQKNPFPMNGDTISVFSPVNIHAYDAQNNHVGITSDGSIETNISDSMYDEIGESKFIYLPEGGKYGIFTNATGEGSFDLKIRTYKESALQREVSYLNVNQTNKTTTSMSLDNDTPTLLVDVNGDGKTIQKIPPTSITNGTTTKGDVSGDGQVSVVDALFIAQYTVGTRTLTSTQLAAADVNNDGQVTIVDALFIAQYTVGLRTL